jgi:hypothetical protein
VARSEKERSGKADENVRPGNNTENVHPFCPKNPTGVGALDS